jgi:hypothetical protein
LILLAREQWRVEVLGEMGLVEVERRGEESMWEIFWGMESLLALHLHLHNPLKHLSMQECCRVCLALEDCRL